MRARLSLVLILFLLGAPLAAQESQAEITFWESVRDSKDPAELRAYLERYPNGAFAALARRRLAMLEPASPAPARSSPALEIAWTLPQEGDTWTYRLREPKRADGSKERTLTVTVTATTGVEVVDQFTLDSGAPLEARHVRGPHLIAEGASLLSPYLPLVMAGAPRIGSIGRVRIVEAACIGGRFVCDAKGRIVGKETVRVAAGTFAATKIVIEQSWRSAAATSGGGAGGRTLTVWYAPEAKRAVKYASRTTFGFTPPIEPDFDLELVSFKLK